MVSESLSSPASKTASAQASGARCCGCCLGFRCCLVTLLILCSLVLPQLVIDMLQMTVRDWSVTDTSKKLQDMSERKHEVVTFNFCAPRARARRSNLPRHRLDATHAQTHKHARRDGIGRASKYQDCSALITDNLTNGFALQTEHPPPKPTFEVVPIRFNYTVQLLNSTVIDDGLGYKYVQWSYYDVVDAADGDVEIVQVNPIYIAAMAQFGVPSETALFAGLSSTALGLVSSDLLGGGIDGLFAPLVAMQGAPALAQTVVNAMASFGLALDEVARNWADAADNPFVARTIDLGHASFALDSQGSLAQYLSAYEVGVVQLPSLVQETDEVQALLQYAQMLGDIVASEWVVEPMALTVAEAESLFVVPSGECIACDETDHSCCSILAPSGGVAWATMGLCLGAAASLEEQEVCISHQGGIVALFLAAGTNVAMISGKIAAIVDWMSRFGASTGALRASMLGLADAFGHGDLGLLELSSLTDLKYLQFGAGLLSQAALESAAATSLADHELFREQGVCTPVELFAYLNHANGPLASGSVIHALAVGLASAAAVPSTATVSLGFSMTIAQARAFLETMASSNDLIGLAGMFGAALAADPSCSSADCTAARAALTTAGPIAATYGKLVINVDSEPVIALCDPAKGIGLIEDDSALSSGQCALLALAYVDYLTGHLGPRFIMGCQLVGGAQAVDPLVSGGFTLRSDGTGAGNSGLFVRRTVRELWFGWDDPLLALAGENASYHGMAGIDVPEPADLTAMFDEGTQVPRDWTYSFTSGKGRLTDRAKVLRHPDEKAMGGPGYPGYRLSDGKPNGGDFDPEGLHKVEEQPMLEKWPSAFEALQSGLTTSPAEAIASGQVAEGQPLSMYITDLRRNMVLRCEHDCPWYKVHNQVDVKAFALSNESHDYVLHKDGVPSPDCGGTVSQQHYESSVALGMPPAGNPSSCDYRSRYPWVFDVSQAFAAPAAVTLPYYGYCDSSVRNAVSIVDPALGAEVEYDAEAHGPGLWFEPFSGWLVKGNERFQNNWMIERSSLDSPMYANIFGASDDNNDVFVWPYMWVNREQGLTPAQANEFASGLYGGYLAAKMILLVGLVIAVLMLVTFCLEIKRFQHFRGPADAGKVLPR